MKICPFEEGRECLIPQRERSDQKCVACMLAELARGLKEWHEERGQRFDIVWFYPENMPSIARLAGADKIIRCPDCGNELEHKSYDEGTKKYSVLVCSKCGTVAE